MHSLDLRRGWLHIVQNFRMPPVFVEVGMAPRAALRKISGVSSEGWQRRNGSGVEPDDAGVWKAA